MLLGKIIEFGYNDYFASFQAHFNTSVGDHQGLTGQELLYIFFLNEANLTYNYMFRIISYLYMSFLYMEFA